jgi:hypothetical protein|tara:strand:- start:6573 stop:6884 length:312 start_codon:yes stop_codon:yes gene_type:complete
MAKLGKKLTQEHKDKISKGCMGHVQPESQKEAVRMVQSMTWIVTTPHGKQVRVVNLCEYGRKHNLGPAWQGNCVKHGHSKGYYVKRVSRTKSDIKKGRIQVNP